MAVPYEDATSGARARDEITANMVEQAKNDLRLFGNAFFLRDADGTVKLVHPEDVRVEFPPTQKEG